MLPDSSVASRPTPLARARRAWSAVWDEPQPADPPVLVWRDRALVGVVVVAVVIEGLARPDLPWRWLQVAAALVLVPTLLWRRTHPLLPVVGTTVVSTVLTLVTGSDGDLVTAVFGAILVYAVFRWGSGRQAVVGGGLLLASLGLTWALGGATAADTAGGAAVVTMLGASGLAVRFRSTARERALAQARAQERERIARDMHDIVGHHVSGIAVRAQAGLAAAEARLARGDVGNAGSVGDGKGTGDDPLEAALRVIESEAKNTLVEMRTLVRTLREDEQGRDGQGTDGQGRDEQGRDEQGRDEQGRDEQGPDGTARLRVPTTPAGLTTNDGSTGGDNSSTSASDGDGPSAVAPTPRAADIVRLAAGPPSPVVVTVRGEVEGVRSDVGEAAYRIAQESVTNARRHAGGRTWVEVALTVEDRALRLRVSDDGEPLTAPFTPGNGIAGMRVRARELGGDVTVGPERSGGWAVEAVLPLTGGHA